MDLIWFHSLVLAACVPLVADPQPKPQPKPGAAASAVFAGRSGKPMAKARLFIGEVLGDGEVLYAKTKLAANVSASTDDQGRFQITGLPAGRYAIRIPARQPRRRAAD